MYVPFLSSRGQLGRRDLSIRGWLERRKGGGGGGGSGSSRGGSSSSSAASSAAKSSSSGSSSSSSWWSSSSSSSSSTSSSSSSSFKVSKAKKSQSSKTKKKIIWKSKSNTWTKTVGVASIIPAGYPFAGRIAGGGVRENIYGSRTYGSGYPGITGRGTSGRGFPFFFWPLSWPLAAGAGTGAALYLHNNYEYGAPSNTSRPGGPMAYTIFSSASVAPNTPSTFRFLADNNTVLLMYLEASTACGPLMDTSTTYTPVLFGDTEGVPSPEQAIQYYRASTGVLTLDGYNNTGTYAVEGTPDLPLPSDTNYGLLSCLNATIGSTLPLIDGSSGLQALPSINLAGLIGVVWMFLWAS